MNIPSFWSLEGWKSFFDWATIFLIAGTVLTGAAALLIGREINKRQEKTILELENRANESATKLETERIKRLELQSKVAWRNLSEEQKATLVECLAGSIGGVVIVSSLNDPEGSAFADEFDDALHKARWETLRTVNHVTRDAGVFLGVYQGTPNESPAMAILERLRSGLHAINQSFVEKTFDARDEKTMTPYFQPGYVYLVVAHKPAIEPDK